MNVLLIINLVLDLVLFLIFIWLLLLLLLLLKLLYNYISTWMIRYFFPDFLSPTILIALIELRIALIWLDWLEIGGGVELYMLLMLFYDLLIDDISYVDDIS